MLSKPGNSRPLIWHGQPFYRKAIFVGDFIDRDPKQGESIEIVRRMVDADSALAVMGNHEFNAIAWFLPDERNPGEYLRLWGANYLIFA